MLDRAIAADRRWSVLHHGRAQMLDHILASRALYGHFRAIEVHNEGLGDEALGYGKALHSAASYHAPVVAQFDFGRAGHRLSRIVARWLVPAAAVALLFR